MYPWMRQAIPLHQQNNTLKWAKWYVLMGKQLPFDKCRRYVLMSKDLPFDKWRQYVFISKEIRFDRRSSTSSCQRRYTSICKDLRFSSWSDKYDLLTFLVRYIASSIPLLKRDKYPESGNRYVFIFSFLLCITLSLRHLQSFRRARTGQKQRFGFSF